jgi:hypothetical protein
MPAGQAKPQMDPFISRLKALFAAVGGFWDDIVIGYFQMFASAHIIVLSVV